MSRLPGWPRPIQAKSWGVANKELASQERYGRQSMGLPIEPVLGMPCTRTNETSTLGWKELAILFRIKDPNTQAGSESRRLQVC